MKLSELVEFYRANGFVVVSAGNGCAGMDLTLALIAGGLFFRLW